MRKSLLVACLAFAVALCVATPSALALSIKARLDHVIVVGDQVYEGGEITLRTVSRGNLMQMSIDGRPVALFVPVFRGVRSEDATPRLVFNRDERGFPHLAYVLYESEHGPTRQVITFRITALSTGLASLPNYAPYGETYRLAQR
jgi:hypothetical protein